MSRVSFIGLFELMKELMPGAAQNQTMSSLVAVICLVFPF